MNTYEEVAIKIEPIMSLHLLKEDQFYTILGAKRNLIHIVEYINPTTKTLRIHYTVCYAYLIFYKTIANLIKKIFIFFL